MGQGSRSKWPQSRFFFQNLTKKPSAEINLFQADTSPRSAGSTGEMRFTAAAPPAAETGSNSKNQVLRKIYTSCASALI